MTRAHDTRTLGELIDAVADDADLLAACLQSLGYTETEMESGSVIDRWQIFRPALRRRVGLTVDSFGRIDSESCPQWIGQ